MKRAVLVLFLAVCLTASYAENLVPNVVGKLPMGKLAFVTGKNFGGAGTIVVLGMRADPFPGAAPQFTVDGNLVFSNPHPPPGGGRSLDGLYIRDLGANSTRVIEDTEWDADSPCLSPDGSRLVFVKWPEGRNSSQIHVCNLDGSGDQALTSGEHYDWSPHWSPDGKQIVFETTRDGERQIYVMSSDGSNPVNLCKSKILCHAPSWSPDGQHIAYMSWAKSGKCNIIVMKSDGSEKTNVSNGGARDSEPVWSPDGRWIAFTRTVNNPPEASTMDIWIMRSDGTEQQPLTQNAEGVSSYAMTWAK